MNIQAKTNPDKGVQQIAPGISRAEFQLNANVTQLEQKGETLFAGLGNGQVVSVLGDAVTTVAAHSGAITALTIDAQGAVYSAGQDGTIVRSLHGHRAVIHQTGGEWVNAMAVSPAGTRIAVAYGRSVVVFNGGQIVAKFDDHPSTVTGLAFAAGGNQIAASRYNGVTLWSVEDLRKPENLTWAGSLTGLSVSPNDQYVAAATQDREIHMWDLVSGRDFRLGGYQRKVKEFGWTDDGSYLFTSGADVMVAWGLAGDPGAIPPVEIGYAYSQTVSAVAPTGTLYTMVGGFTDGSLVVGEARKGTAKIARGADGASITGLTASACHRCFGFGTSAGVVGRISLDTALS